MKNVVGIISLGCPKNRVDSEVILGQLKNENYTVSDDTALCDIIIINTCGFIESAKQESIDTILEIAELKKTAKLKYLIVTGCLAQRYGEELFTSLPEVDGIIGTDVFPEIVSLIKEIKKGKRVIRIERGECIKCAFPRVLTTPKHYAYLKIAEGCNNCCSYCVIPKIRGAYKSKPFDVIIEEAKSLAKNGIKELILVAQDTTLYGKDLYGELRLPELLRELSKISEIQWIRLMYMYPNSFTDELIECFVSLPKLVKYVDIPLQHASDRVLKEMNRNDTKAEIESLLKKLRMKVPGIVIRTTFIVGFPGETDVDFQELCDFVQEYKFENAGVFQYSKEDGTFAGARKDQVGKKVKEKRYNALMALQAKISETNNQMLEGKIFDVIFEGYSEDDKTLAYGRFYGQAPEIDGNIFIENVKNIPVGEIVKVKIIQGFTYEIVGELEEV
ncbi:MAG: 30S ribosomal protein S12 methylthiotransferase RimO [Acidaminococcaceae bacterium]|nr:30S ribosomal protein S12 methylthiotransferase RimO [Acidaminococcaceae bacterium]MDO4935724.1 30S ribosomal protein S12 methylthiotransferase RimO [Phascolarctobacterium sp.]